jgi:hypothetical protein
VCKSDPTGSPRGSKKSLFFKLFLKSLRNLFNLRHKSDFYRFLHKFRTFWSSWESKNRAKTWECWSKSRNRGFEQNNSETSDTLILTNTPMLLLVLRPTPEWTDRLFDQILSILNRFWLQFCRCGVDLLSIFYLQAGLPFFELFYFFRPMSKEQITHNNKHILKKIASVLSCP